MTPTSTSRRVLITGASRGLGLELARQYAADGWSVHAACRRPDAASELQALAGASTGGEVHVHPLDVTRSESVRQLAAELAGASIDLLLNNAGVLGARDSGQQFGSLDYERWLDVLDVNTLGPMRVAETFADMVAASDGKLVVTITSGMGSIEQNSGGYYLYRTSKAAVNCAMRGLAQDLRARGVIVALLHPGWVRTDMGGRSASLSPEESVAGMREVIAGLGPESSGRFFDWQGRTIPW
jgi:NAD(P)-dependent dehydrogenase (short-subunit alcohol dehydrogenase family)